MYENGFIKLYRKLLKWQWYDDINTKTVFIHLLLTVNFKSVKWHGIDVKRGSRIASYDILAKETHLTIDKVRTAIKHLESTEDITRSSHGKYTVISVNNYDFFQKVPSKSPDNSQDNPKDNPREIPRSSQHNKNNKEYKEEIEEDKKGEGTASPSAPSPKTSNAYGEYGHVNLTAEQYMNLVNQYGESNIKKYIQKIDDWVQLKNRSYNDYYIALRDWMDKDGVKKIDPAMKEYESVINQFLY